MSSIALILTLTALVVAAPSVCAAEKTIVLAHLNKNDAGDNPTGAMALAFKRTLEDVSGKTFRVDIFPEGQLGGDEQTVELARKGIIQSAISSVGGVSKLYPPIGVLDFPFAFRSIEQTYAIFDGPFGRLLADDMERKAGFRVIGYGDQGGFFVLTNSKRPVRSPADMAGLRIRTMGLDTHKSFVGSLGGEAVGMAWKDVYGALRSQVVDGQMNPISILKFARFDEVQKYLTLTNHFFTPYVWTMNSAFHAALADQEKSWIAAAAAAGVAASRATAKTMVASDRGLAALAQRMTIYTPTAREIDAFRKATQPTARALIEEKFGPEGAALLTAFLKAIEQAKE